MTRPPQPYPFDSRPLTEPVNARDVAAFRREMRAKHPTPVRTIVMTVITVVILAIILIIAISMVPFFWNAMSGLWQSAVGPIAIVLLSLFAALFIAIVVWNIARMLRRRLSRYRIARFAKANGMVYVDRVESPALPGMIFRRGSSRKATKLVRGFKPRFVEFGNYEYRTGTDDDRRTVAWGYVAVKLDVPLPNIVLDALGNNTLGSNLPAHLSRDQRLSLEGDFDKYCSLYCPKGYEQDALYLFTPDIMARFIDHAAQLDVEIVDDWLFLYSQRDLSTKDPATWAWLFGTVGALLTKFDQWARWRDDRLRVADAAAAPVAAVSTLPAPALPFSPPTGVLTPPPGVARQGRRLKKGGTSCAVVGIFIVIGLMVITPFALMAVVFLTGQVN